MNDVTMPKCDRCHSPLERGDLRCAICGQRVPLETGSNRDSSNLVTRVMRCDDCGATVNYNPEFQAPHCGFCGAVQRIETVEDPSEKVNHILPFTINYSEARKALQKWLGTLGFFRPNALKSGAKIESMQPLQWVGWVFDVDTEISWTADSNEGSRRSAWAPHSGQINHKFDDILVSASRGLTDEETRFLSASYSLNTAKDDVEADKDVGDIQLEQYDVQRSQARMCILDTIEQLAIQTVEYGYIPGSRFRNIKVSTLLTGLHTKRYAFPAYVMAYRYKDRLFRVVVSGQDDTYVHGNAPYSWIKILVTMVIVLLISIIAVCTMVSV